MDFLRKLFGTRPHNTREPNIAEMKEMRDVDSLVQILHHKEFNRQLEAAAALQDLNDPQGMAFLVTTLKDSDLDRRALAALFLGRMHDPRAVEPLVKAIVDMTKEQN